MKFDLGVGNSICVRKAFYDASDDEGYIQSIIDVRDLLNYDYPNHDGDPRLLEITKSVIKRQTDQEYRHVFLTNGATGGVVIALRAYHQMGLISCCTRNAPYYVRYPSMIKASGLERIDSGYSFLKNETIILLDLPSNPLGLTDTIGEVGIPLIIDGAYLNRVYAPIFYGLPRHDVMVGSYSKLLGINGIRVGWVATNDDLLAERLRDLIGAEYCGLSQASTDILLYALEGFDWDKFEVSAKAKLDYNRTEWTKLERFFCGTPVSNVGMFYYGPMDSKAQQIFEKAGVIWTKGSALGTDDGFARFNLGQDNELIQKAVKAILKADRI